MGKRTRILIGGGALVAFLGGGAQLARVELTRQDQGAQLSTARERLAFREAEAAHASRLELELSQLRVSTEGQLNELTEARAEVERLDRSLNSIEEQHAAAQRAADASFAEQRLDAQRRLAEVETLRRQAEEVSRERAKAVTRLERVLDEAQARAATAEKTVESLELDVRAKQRRLDEQDGQLAAADVRLEALDQQVGRAQAQADEAERLLTTLREAGVNVDRLTGVDPMPRVHAKVVKVDAVSNPAVLLVDVGASAGLQVGDELVVMREGRIIARLVVEETRSRISSTRLVYSDRGVKLRPGDVVLSRSPER